MAEELPGIEEEVNSEIASAAEPFVDPRRQGKEYYQRRSTKEKRLETEEEAEAGQQSCQEGDLRRRWGRQEGSPTAVLAATVLQEVVATVLVVKIVGEGEQPGRRLRTLSWQV